MDREGLTELRSYVDSLWEDVLSAFKRSLESEEPADKGGNR